MHVLVNVLPKCSSSAIADIKILQPEYLIVLNSYFIVGAELLELAYMCEVVHMRANDL